MKDEASGYRRVFFMKTKDEVSDLLKQFFIDAEKETERKAISLRTDNGTEYVNEKVKKVLKSMGNFHHPMLSNALIWQNGKTGHYVTLHDHCYSTDLSRTDCYLLWTEAVGTAAYLRNRVPNQGIMSTTPYYEWYKKKPDVSHLRVFDGKAFVRIPDSKRRKMDPKAKRTVFVRYDRLTNKIYRVFDPIKKIIERVSVVIIKDVADVNNQVLFPLPSDEQVEDFEESSVEDREELPVEDRETSYVEKSRNYQLSRHTQITVKLK